MNLVIVNGSPKINEESVSGLLVDMIVNQIDKVTFNTDIVSVRQSITKNKTREDFETLINADAVIFVFPLYVFCLPGILTRYLEDYYKYFLEQGERQNSQKVYAVVNCGFPESDINLEAVNVIKSFSRHINSCFRFGVQIGGGGMLLAAKGAPFMKKTLRNLNEAFNRIIEDITDQSLQEIENISISMNFPRWLYLFMGNRSWASLARKNGLKKKELYRRPYC